MSRPPPSDPRPRESVVMEFLWKNEHLTTVQFVGRSSAMEFQLGPLQFATRVEITSSSCIISSGVGSLSPQFGQGASGASSNDGAATRSTEECSSRSPHELTAIRCIAAAPRRSRLRAAPITKRPPAFLMGILRLSQSSLRAQPYRRRTQSRAEARLVTSPESDKHGQEATHTSV